MEQNSNEKDRENLSMEEYLKRRQAVKTRETASRASRGVDSVSALLVAAIDALRRSEATGESISAKISVHKYIAIRIKTPSSAEIRFSFFM